MQGIPNPSAGKLIYLMGASGSGKDSLLRAVSAWQQAGDSVVAARRNITRKARAGCEPHSVLSLAGFEALEREGFFLFSWQAHGYLYGIGRQILSDLASGKHVVVNGSRRYLKTAQSIFPGLVPVCLEVAPQILESRLIARGRENPEEIAARLQQAREFSNMIPPDALSIDNNLQIEIAAEKLRKLLNI